VADNSGAYEKWNYDNQGIDTVPEQMDQAQSPHGAYKTRNERSYDAYGRAKIKEE
jgi:hypothetical protein